LHHIKSSAIIYLAKQKEGIAIYKGYGNKGNSDGYFPYFSIGDFITNFTLLNIPSKDNNYDVQFEVIDVPAITRKYYYISIHSLFEDLKYVI